MTKHLPQFVTDWIRDNTTPSSNTKNVVSIVEKVPEEEVTNKSEHVIHWRTESIRSMFERCKLEVIEKFGEEMSQSYFYSCIPPFVRLKTHQDGLCPIHHTGISVQKEFEQRRRAWHKNCTCECDFCSADGCAHGKNPLGEEAKCSSFTCQRCKFAAECDRENTLVPTVWSIPVQEWRKVRNLDGSSDRANVFYREVDCTG